MTSLPPPLAALEARLGLPEGDLVDEDAARAEAALADVTEDALALVSSAKAETWRLYAPGIVSVIILRAARREFENPRGLTTEGLGEHSVGVGTHSAYLTPDEELKVRRAARAVGFTGTVRIHSAYNYTG